MYDPVQKKEKRKKEKEQFSFLSPLPPDLPCEYVEFWHIYFQLNGEATVERKMENGSYSSSGSSCKGQNELDFYQIQRWKSYSGDQTALI